MNKVKVSEYRRLADRMFDWSNKHYHSCVGDKELIKWRETAQSVFSEGENTDCSRANECDKKSFVEALHALGLRLQTVKERMKLYYVIDEADNSNVLPGFDGTITDKNLTLEQAERLLLRLDDGDAYIVEQDRILH